MGEADRDVRFAAAPNVATKVGDWSSRSNPGGLSRSMISPNVTTFVIYLALAAATPATACGPSR